MKLVEYYRGGRVFRSIDVTKKELFDIVSKLDYVVTRKDIKEVLKHEKDDDVVGTIMGDVNNIISDLKLESELNITDKEFPICQSPDCWFVDKKLMLNTYKPLIPDTLFTFGEAIELLNLGYAVARLGWNGKGLFLFLSSSEILDRIKDVTSKWSDYKIDPFIIMATAQKTFQPGWLASQADMLAEDYIIVQ